MKRLIIFGIIFLFIATSVSSSGINTVEEFNDVSTEKTDIESIDVSREIVTLISSHCNPLNLTWSGDRNQCLELWEHDGIYIEGIRYILFPFFIVPFFKKCSHIIAPHFIELIYQVHYGSCFIMGIALGNITWE
jgi:hypothetical protein